jgi:hypothetical protein
MKGLGLLAAALFVLGSACGRDARNTPDDVGSGGSMAGGSASAVGGGSPRGGAATAGVGAASGEAGAIAAGTSGAEVGSPCVPSEERSASFSAASVQEVVIGSGNAACASGICLANHFRGRVTCPYGQTADDVANLPASSSARCRLPAADGQISAVAVSQPVPPQFVSRRAESTVTCSCHCAGPSTDVDYCTCPSGTECVALNEPLGLPNEDPNLVGSFCIKTGTAYDRSAPNTLQCQAQSTDPATDCGNDRMNP